MRINYFGQNGNTNIGAMPTTMTGPLILANDPNGPLEAASKRYIDTALSSLNASNVKTGVLNINRLPAFTGEVTSPTGSGFMTLSNTGVVAGDHTKVTVDNKGRVLRGSALTNDDIPPFSWNKVTSDIPNTLNGYGITNALSFNGGHVTGNLTLNKEPTDPLHAVSKQYIDNLAGNGSDIVTGMIIKRASSSPLTNFLRCNGGQVSKTMYPVLYSMLGDALSFDLQPGNGRPWQQQYQLNDVQSSDLKGWVTAPSLPAASNASQVIVTKNKVYFLSGTTYKIYVAPINSDGTLGMWVLDSNLPANVSQFKTVVALNKVYLIGGNLNNGTVNKEVYTTQIDSNGSIGTWVLSSQLPVNLTYFEVIVTKNRIYTVGGAIDGSSTYNSYYAVINSNGTLGAWTLAQTTPFLAYNGQLIGIKNKIYATCGVNSLNVYSANVATDGTLGTWTLSGTLPISGYGSQAFVTKTKAYLIGVMDNSGSICKTMSANINADGTLGSWVLDNTNVLPGAMYDSQLIATKSKLYMLGGSNSGTIHSDVNMVNINGGLNDYSQYYDGTIVYTDPANFRLPDLTSSETPNEYFFIRT